MESIRRQSIYIQNLGLNIGEHMLIDNFPSFIFFKGDDFLDPTRHPVLNMGGLFSS